MYTRADLISLRTEDIKRERAKQVELYVSAIEAAVLYEAKYGFQTYLTFWLIRAMEAPLFIRHAVGLCYSWKRRLIAASPNPAINTLLVRPIPEDLLDEVLTLLVPILPDCSIRRISTELVVNGFAQDFLEIRWT
jgi:hypothetical protein